MAGLSRFERPVIVQVGRHGSERIVLDVNDAAPMDVCLQVLRGKARSPVARRAFVAAELEAKILRGD
jgi:hypothetical protein